MSAGQSFLPYGRQCVDEDDIRAVVATLRSDYLTTGPATDAFEEAFRTFTGAPHAVVCSNGTAALHLAAMSLDLCPGDAVIVPTMTFLATASAPHLAGAEIVFADVDPDTGLMTPETLDAALHAARAAGLRTRGVFAVHLNGQCAEPKPLLERISSADIELVEDASHAVGGYYADGHGVGASDSSAMATFSFHPVKSMTMGEGGMVTCTSAKRAARLRLLRNHGMTRDASSFDDPSSAFDTDGAANPWYYEMHAPGLNYRATDIACALGMTQLAKLPGFAARRAALLRRYQVRLNQLNPHVQALHCVPQGTPAWHLCVALIDFPALGTTRARVMQALHARGIGTQVHYLPVHRQPYYRYRYGVLDLPGAERYYARCLSLPLFPAMHDADPDRVVDALVDALAV